MQVLKEREDPTRPDPTLFETKQKMSTDPKRKGFTSTTPPASLAKILHRTLSRLKSRTPSNITPVSSLSLKSVWLYDWWLVKADGKGLAVSGFAFREGVGTRLFCSEAIVKRHYTTILETKDGITVTVSGFINRDRTRKNGFSFQICERFQLGFPYSWEELATQLCGEESANSGSPQGKLGFDEPKMSSSISTKAASVSFDDLPVTRIRDILMCPLRDSKDCALADMLEQSCSNNVTLSPISTTPDSKNPVTIANTVLDETPRKHKRKADQKHKDGGKIPHTVDTVMGDCITPGRGIVTRSMSRLRNLREIREETPSSNSTAFCKAFRNNPEKVSLHSSIKSKDNALLSTSEAAKNQSRVMRGTSAGKDSIAVIARLMNLRTIKEESLSSNSTVSHTAFRNDPEKVLLQSSIKSKDSALLSTSEAARNQSRVMRGTSAGKDSNVVISRLMNLRKMKDENLSSNSTVSREGFRNDPEKVLLQSSIKCKDNALLSMSEATKNRSGGMISTSARKGSWAITSSEKVMEVPVVPLVRRSSSRQNSRKDYRETQC